MAIVGLAQRHLAHSLGLRVVLQEFFHYGQLGLRFAVNVLTSEARAGAAGHNDLPHLVLPAGVDDVQRSCGARKEAELDAGGPSRKHPSARGDAGRRGEGGGVPS
eukprot:scaffold1882_cov384-Prasinococcus_capsulatus_cf.AAC.5